MGRNQKQRALTEDFEVVRLGEFRGVGMRSDELKVSLMKKCF